MSPKVKKIEKAVKVLEKNIASICTVEEWAERMGYNSTDYFSRKIRNYYGVRPKELIVEKKLDKIRACLRQNPDKIYFCIARDLGFADNDSLYKFVKRHTGKSITGLKRESEKGV